MGTVGRPRVVFAAVSSPRLVSAAVMSSSLSLVAAPPSAVAGSAGAAAAVSSPAGVHTFLAAFHALHHNPDSAVKAEANRWLMSFQASRDAWQVSDAVLHTAQLSDELYYNAANILRHKLLHSYGDLPGHSPRTRRPLLTPSLPSLRTHVHMSAHCYRCSVVSPLWQMRSLDVRFVTLC